MLPLTCIQAVQGTGLYSPLSGVIVRVQGVVTGKTGHGFFIQEPAPLDAGPLDAASQVGSISATLAQTNQTASSAIFIFSIERPAFGAHLEIIGKVIDFARAENERPTTQIELHEFSVIAERGPDVDPIWLNANTLPEQPEALAKALNNLEGMRVGILSGAMFSAPSNPFGDYVVLPSDIANSIPLSDLGSAILDPANPDRWLPGFRISRVEVAPIVNVGDILLEDVVGPLNYRANSYQILARGPLRVKQIARQLSNNAQSPGPEFTSVLTLNAFNLDQQFERPERVDDPRRDIDHDVADLRFDKLGAVIVNQAGSPAIVALQEIQDNDGAELSATTDASYTYALLVQACKKLGGPLYQWVDIAPKNASDGGQPGGNIRNAFLYDPQRVSLVAETLRLIGTDSLAFEDSRKALMAQFRVRSSGQILAVLNVHLASKRHQNSLFAPNLPGFDPKEAQRIAQALEIREVLTQLEAQGLDYYVTGDFNDFDFSETLKTLCAQASVNLVQTLPRAQRYDYNHRGKLHTLMHAIVAKRQAVAGRYKFEILHGNELTGVQPGTMGTRATDHAYVISHLRVGAS